MEIAPENGFLTLIMILSTIMPDVTMYYGKFPIYVLFENSFCLIFNKPSGLAVQGGKGIKVSLDSILSEKMNPRPFLVHRLDSLILSCRKK